MAKTKRGPILTDPSLGRDKVDAEGACRYCGGAKDLEMAHTIGKAEQDLETVGPRGGRRKYVPEAAVIPLCGGFTENNCHYRHDHHEIDILPYLYLEEEINAVRAAGGIYSALIRLCPTEFSKGAKVG